MVGFETEVHGFSNIHISLPILKCLVENITFKKTYKGIVPPTKRSEKDFDPAGKYHIGSNTPYIRYSNSLLLRSNSAVLIYQVHIGQIFLMWNPSSSNFPSFM